MVMFVMPMVCETSACWLCNGKSSTNDCAGVIRAVTANSKHNNKVCNPVLRRNGFNARSLNMHKSPFKAHVSPCDSIRDFLKLQATAGPPRFSVLDAHESLQ